MTFFYFYGWRKSILVSEEIFLMSKARKWQKWLFGLWHKKNFLLKLELIFFTRKNNLMKYHKKWDKKINGSRKMYVFTCFCPFWDISFVKNQKSIRKYNQIGSKNHYPFKIWKRIMVGMIFHSFWRKVVTSYLECVPILYKRVHSDKA